MRDRTRNIIGQILFIVGLLLITATFAVGKYEAEIMRHDTTACNALLIAAAIAFIAGLILLASTGNDSDGFHKS